MFGDAAVFFNEHGKNNALDLIEHVADLDPEIINDVMIQNKLTGVDILAAPGGVLEEVAGEEPVSAGQKAHLLGYFVSEDQIGLEAYVLADAGRGLDRPEVVAVQGDTTTVFCAALCAFYHHLPIGHVEAGLRTGNKYSPFPEEVNRILATHLSTLHFAPTEKAKENLIKEGISPDKVFVTGNTVIDALYWVLDKIEHNPPDIPELPDDLVKNKRPLVLITGHRRENFGEGFRNICQAIAQLADKYPQIAFVYPVHLNPNVKKPVFELLSKHSNIYLTEPLSYLPFILLMKRAKIILTDSGGIQEEAPSLGKPVLVMRKTTERPEAVDAGTVKLVGTNPQLICAEAEDLLNNSTAYEKMARAHNPYGDGKAAQRIINTLSEQNNVNQ